MLAKEHIFLFSVTKVMLYKMFEILCLSKLPRLYLPTDNAAAKAQAYNGVPGRKLIRNCFER